MKILRSRLLIVVQILLLLILMVKVVQGIDFTDVGFYAGTYRLFFQDPQSIVYSQMYWLSNLIGALVLQISGDRGLLGLNLFGLLIQILMLVLSFLTWKMILPVRQALWVPLLLGALLGTPYTYTVNYNSLSAITLGLAAMACLRYFVTPSTVWLIVAGFATGLSFGIRPPNLIFAIIAPLFVRDRGMRSRYQPLVVYLVSIVAALVVQGILVSVVGHWSGIQEGFAIVGQKSVDPASTHSVIKIFYRYWKDLAEEGLTFLVSSIVFWVLVVGVKRASLKRWWNRRIAFVALFFAIAILNVSTYESIVWRLFLFLTLGLLVQDIVQKKSKISSILLIYLASISAGSNSGFFNCQAGLILTTPWIFKIMTDQLERVKVVHGTLSWLLSWSLGLGTVVVTIGAFADEWKHTMRDSANRFELRAEPNVRGLKNILTTPARSQYINELDQVLSSFGAGTNVIAYSEMPMVYFMRDFRAPLRNIWPDLYEHGRFQHEFQKNIIDPGIYPVLLLNKFSLRDSDWPTGDKKMPYRRNEDRNYSLLIHFRDQNQYQLRWSNDYFELWVKP